MGDVVTDQEAFPGWMGWARVGGSPRSPQRPTSPFLSVHHRVQGGAPHREKGTAVLAGAPDGHRGLGVGRPAGPPRPRPQVSAANMYVSVSFIFIFDCFLSLLFFSQTPLLLWPQRAKPRAADKRL